MYAVYLFMCSFIHLLFHFLSPVTLVWQRTERDRRFRSTSLDKETGIAKGATYQIHADSQNRSLGFLIWRWMRRYDVWIKAKRADIIVSLSGSNPGCILVSGKFFWLHIFQTWIPPPLRWGQHLPHGENVISNHYFSTEKDISWLLVPTKSLLQMDDLKPGTPQGVMVFSPHSCCKD